MMKPIRPHISKGATYPPEFREEAVRYWLSSGQTLSAVASDLGLSPQCLRDWRQQLESPVPQTTVSQVNGVAHPSDQLALAREIGLLDAPPVTQPGERFYSDITSIPTQEGWLFTAATLDGYSRRCARAPSGWGVPPTIWKRLWCCGRHSVP